MEQVRVADAETALKRIQTRLKEEETRTLLKDDFLDNDNLGDFINLNINIESLSVVFYCRPDYGSVICCLFLVFSFTFSGMIVEPFLCIQLQVTF